MLGCPGPYRITLGHFKAYLKVRNIWVFFGMFFWHYADALINTRYIMIKPGSCKTICELDLTLRHRMGSYPFCLDHQSTCGAKNYLFVSSSERCDQPDQLRSQHHHLASVHSQSSLRTSPKVSSLAPVPIYYYLQITLFASVDFIFTYMQVRSCHVLLQHTSHVHPYSKVRI